MDERIAAEKRRVRAEMRVIRARVAADPADRGARSARIWARIVSILEEMEIRTVMLFQSLPTEPDTSAWGDWFRHHRIEVFVPEVDGPELRVMPGDVDPTALDLVIVPGLAFTADGRRLGQGGGHFDRFLSRLRPNCVTIGVGYTEQLVGDLPVEAHDVALTHVIVA